MPYAIMRWGKVTSQAQADKATGHNYRKDRVVNADREAPHPNVEFINSAERGYWELAEERIGEVVTRKVRDDQVRCMEVILTASPEFFERDENGGAVNMADSQWAKDQVDFLKKTFGEKNVLSCTLHQDEKSPHFHAIIVPITEDGRLSAKELFNPKTLTSYQSQYAEAMQVHGLRRGIEHSQAEHQPMQRMYGQQAQTAAELSAQLGPASSYQDVQVKPPSVREMLDLDKWAAKTSAQVNEQARTQVEQANQRAERAQNLALENAAAKEQVRVLQKQLSTSEGLKEANFEKAQVGQARVNDVAMRLAGGEQAPASLLATGNRLLDEATEQVRDCRERIAKLHQESDRAEKSGDYGRVAELWYGVIHDGEKRQKEQETRLSGYKGGASRLAELDAQQVRAAAEQVERERAEKLATEQRRIDQAREQMRVAEEQAQQQVQQLAENERKKRIDLENERSKIERISEQVLKMESHILSLEWFARSVRMAGLQVEIPSQGQLVLSIPGSENRFNHQDLKLWGREFAGVVDAQLEANSRSYDKERGASSDRERD